MFVMKRFFSKKHKNSGRGFTIAEAIIAMTVILAVSAVAITTIRMAMTSTSKDLMYERLRICAENSLEAFKYSDDIAGFESLKDDDLTGSDGLYTYVSSNEIYTLNISVAYSDSERDTFRAVITGGSKSYLDIEYTKGE